MTETMEKPETEELLKIMELLDESGKKEKVLVKHEVKFEFWEVADLADVFVDDTTDEAKTKNTENLKSKITDISQPVKEFQKTIEDLGLLTVVAVAGSGPTTRGRVLANALFSSLPQLLKD